MRISNIEASNFFSFEHLALSNIQPALNVIVGPNGAGKTNLLRLLTMARDALDVRTRALWEPLAVWRDRSATRKVRITIEVTGEWEKQLFTKFFHAALATRRDVPQEIQEAYEQWISDFDPTVISGMFAGCLEVACSHGPAPHWSITYQFSHAGVNYEWWIDGRSMQGIRRAENDVDVPFQGGPVLIGLPRGGNAPETLLEFLQRFASRPIGAEDVLPGRNQIVQPAVRSQNMGPIPEALNGFGQLTGLPIAGAPYEYSGIQLFQTLFNQSLVLTTDLRGFVKEEYKSDNLAQTARSIDISDSSDLSLYLFLLKNGDSQERGTYASMQSIFSELTGASFEVGLERPVVSREGAKDDVRLKLTIHSHGIDVPVAFAGAGLRESLFLSASLAGPEERVLCLDEPALNLHPSLQRKVAQKFAKRMGQILLITHSPYMVTAHGATDLARIVRFYLKAGVTELARLRSEDHSGADAQRWLKEIWRSPDSIALLFCRGVILVEGETEAAALPIWFAKSPTANLRGTPEDNNVVIYSVGGAGTLATYSRFLRAFSLPSAVVCDSDQFAIAAFLRQFELEVPRSGEAFQQYRITAESHGVFTLCDDYGQEFEDLAYVQPLLQRARDEVGTNNRVLQGRFIAEATDCPNDVERLYERLLKFLSIT